MAKCGKYITNDTTENDAKEKISEGHTSKIAKYTQQHSTDIHKTSKRYHKRNLLCGRKTSDRVSAVLYSFQKNTPLLAWIVYSCYSRGILPIRMYQKIPSYHSPRPPYPSRGLCVACGISGLSLIEVVISFALLIVMLSGLVMFFRQSSQGEGILRSASVSNALLADTRLSLANASGVFTGGVVYGMGRSGSGVFLEAGSGAVWVSASGQTVPPDTIGAYRRTIRFETLDASSIQDSQ
jgi:hypothetical protein